ncbi:MAG: sigma-70 family RNA polymerase sigma factor [Acidobacteriota bacterium]
MSAELFAMMKRAQEGDPEEKNKLFSFLRARIGTLAKLYIWGDDIEEVVQETMMVVTSQFPSLRTPEALIAFANKVLRNKMGNLYKRRDSRKALLVSLEELEEHPFYTVEEWGPGKLHEIVFEAIELLGNSRPVCRDLLMGLLAGETSEELCQSLSIPPHRLDDRVYKCRSALRRILRERWGLRV